LWADPQGIDKLTGEFANGLGLGVTAEHPTRGCFGERITISVNLGRMAHALGQKIIDIKHNVLG
jgi:hypothetical protein